MVLLFWCVDMLYVSRYNFSIINKRGSDFMRDRLAFKWIKFFMGIAFAVVLAVIFRNYYNNAGERVINKLMSGSGEKFVSCFANNLKMEYSYYDYTTNSYCKENYRFKDIRDNVSALVNSGEIKVNKVNAYSQDIFFMDSFYQISMSTYIDDSKVDFDFGNCIVNPITNKIISVEYIGDNERLFLIKGDCSKKKMSLAELEQLVNDKCFDEKRIELENVRSKDLYNSLSTLFVCEYSLADDCKNLENWEEECAVVPILKNSLPSSDIHELIIGYTQNRADDTQYICKTWDYEDNGLKNTAEVVFVHEIDNEEKGWVFVALPDRAEVVQ